MLFWIMLNVCDESIAFAAEATDIQDAKNKIRQYILEINDEPELDDSTKEQLETNIKQASGSVVDFYEDDF